MSAAGIALGVGGITVANELLFSPAAGGTLQFNWRIIPATAIFAFLLAGLEKIDATIADGIGYTALVTALVVPFGNAKSPLENLDTLLGARK